MIYSVTSIQVGPYLHNSRGVHSYFLLFYSGSTLKALQNFVQAVFLKKLMILNPVKALEQAF
jgi:hypothetical protein